VVEVEVDDKTTQLLLSLELLILVVAVVEVGELLPQVVLA
jgi:hypothetical protein